MDHYLKLLGYEVKDVVTGLTGVCSSVSFDLYGCVQAVITPAAYGKVTESQWFDFKRLIRVGKAPVMELPAFCDVAGGQDKPIPTANPLR